MEPISWFGLGRQGVSFRQAGTKIRRRWRIVAEPGRLASELQAERASSLKETESTKPCGPSGRNSNQPPFSGHEAAGFSVQNGLHEFTGVDRGLRGKRPGETLGGSQLNRGATFSIVTP